LELANLPISLIVTPAVAAIAELLVLFFTASRMKKVSVFLMFHLVLHEYRLVQCYLVRAKYDTNRTKVENIHN